MNRERKYRIWDEGRFLYRGLHDKNWYATPSNDENGSNTVRQCLQTDRNLPVTECVGLNDKNNNPIYEGDIVQYFSGHGNKFKTLVEYITESAHYLPFNDLHFIGDEQGVGFDENKGFEIIGNLYQNPELLSH